MKDIDETIKSRHSVRVYNDKAIEQEKIDFLNEIIDKCNKEGNLNIQLVLNDEETFERYILHYGKLKNAKNYIALVGNKNDKNLDQKCGYFGEKIVLEAKDIGLNTCWVGGSYKKGLVKAKLKKDDTVVCIIAIGYSDTNGNPHKSKEFKDVSISKDVPNWYKKGIEYALLAPTAINQQKFKFKLEDKKTVSLRSGIGPFVKVDLGIVKYHFELGAGYNNFKWKE